MAEHWLSQGDLTRAREFVDRLHASATEHEVHKYIAVAHQLMAKLALANGDTSEAVKQFDAALVELENYPAPLVTWKVHAGRAKLKSQLGDTSAAQESSARATEIVNFIAANVNDANLRETFLNATRAVL
jgi:ATP/maltotriose-dependent transcriptional regulator MalT